MLIAQVEKQPAEVLRRTIDYACRFDDGQTIVEVATTVELEDKDDPTSNLGVDVFILAGNYSIEYFVKGGDNGTMHKITFLVTVSDGQVMEDEVECFVEEY